MRQARGRGVAAVCLAASMLASTAAAQETSGISRRLTLPPQVIRGALQVSPPVRSGLRPAGLRRPTSRAVWTMVGAVGGAVGGAYLGVAIERAARRKDPDAGLTGAFIGMAAGGIGGGITGALISR